MSQENVANVQINQNKMIWLNKAFHSWKIIWVADAEWNKIDWLIGWLETEWSHYISSFFYNSPKKYLWKPESKQDVSETESEPTVTDAEEDSPHSPVSA